MTGNQSSSRYRTTFCDLKAHFQMPPMVSIKEHFYQCWLCFYGPVFWILYMMTTSLELNRNLHNINDNTSMTFSLYEDLPAKETLEFSSDDSAYSPTSTVSTPTTSNSSDEDDSQSIQSNKSFKSTLKTRFQNFKLKQQSLNEAMRRSLLRKSSKSSLSSSDRPSLPFNDYPQELINKTIHPLALDRQVSVSDSLLKSINRKGKQPPAVTPSRHRYNEDGYFNTKTSDLPIKGALDPSLRRKTSPEINSLS